MTNEQLVSKVWNYAHLLRETVTMPPFWNWGELVNLDGDELELQYRYITTFVARLERSESRVFPRDDSKGCRC